MRLFTALELSDESREHLGRLIRSWKQNLSADLVNRLGIDSPPVNWVREENLHVTLRFFGEVADPDLPSLCHTMESMATPPRISLNVDHLECLPPRGPIHVIGAGLSGDVDRLGQLYDLIDRACRRLGLPRDRHAFRPHITLGRLRTPLADQTRSTLDKIAARHMPGPPFTATNFALIQSELLPGGPRYTPLARFPLDSGMVV